MEINRSAFLALTAALATTACAADRGDDTATTETSSDAVVLGCPGPVGRIDSRYIGWRDPAPANEGWDDETPLSTHYAKFFGTYDGPSLYKKLELSNETATPAFTRGKLIFRMRAIRQYRGHEPETITGYWYLHFGYDRELRLALVSDNPEIFYNGDFRRLSDDSWLEYPTGGLKVATASYRRVSCSGFGPVDPPPPPPSPAADCDTSWAEPTSASLPDSFSEGLIGTWIADGPGSWFKRIELRREAYRSSKNSSARSVFRYEAIRQDGSEDEGYYRPDDFLKAGTGQILFYATEKSFGEPPPGQYGPGRCVRNYGLTREGCKLVAKSTYIGQNAEPLLHYRKLGCAE